jgi:hypothetical protein
VADPLSMVGAVVGSTGAPMLAEEYTVSFRVENFGDVIESADGAFVYFPVEHTIGFDIAEVAFSLLDAEFYVNPTASAAATLIPHVVGITIDGGGSAVVPGYKGMIPVPFDALITGWDVYTDPPHSGSIAFDVWRAPYPPAAGDTIIGASERPTLSSQTNNQLLTLTSWSTGISAGDYLAFQVDSVASINRVSLILRLQGA